MNEIECRLNFENRPVRSRDIKGGRKQPPPPATNRGGQEPATNRVNSLGHTLLMDAHFTYIYMIMMSSIHSFIQDIVSSQSILPLAHDHV